MEKYSNPRKKGPTKKSEKKDKRRTLEEDKKRDLISGHNRKKYLDSL